MQRIPLALTALLLLAGTPAVAVAAKPRDLLPDLAQGSPTGVEVVLDEATGAPRLVFDSTIGNVGEGPLILSAKRKPGSSTMEAHQAIRRSDGSTRTVRKVAGVLKFVVASDHRHWHLMGIDRYELWTGNASRRLRRDRKQGFCLGDRYQLTPGRRMRNQPRKPAYPGYCGRDQPLLTKIVEGITVGWGDNYPANIEGQYIDVSGIAPGRYLLVHRIRAGGLLESYPYNNVSCAAIALKAPSAAGQPPTVTVSGSRAPCASTYSRWGYRG
ncbi:MAG TPA: lysyl oxidase family protein [Conexibacter sp.]|nr:lysyl oxidase family protein [Conexibacter sp.]